MDYEKKLSNYRDSKMRLKRSMCRICGLCQYDDQGRLRKKNCAESVNFKIIEECINELEKEWKKYETN